MEQPNELVIFAALTLAVAAGLAAGLILWFRGVASRSVQPDSERNA